MDDVTLVRLARSGDLAALARLFERHRPRLLAIGRGVLGDEDAVAEVVQETALVALTQLQQLRDPALVGAWLAGIARNLCVPIAATSDPGFDTLGSMRQWVESIIDAIKGQLGLENHGGRTMQGVFTRVAQRLAGAGSGDLVQLAAAYAWAAPRRLQPLTEPQWNHSSSRIKLHRGGRCYAMARTMASISCYGVLRVHGHNANDRARSSAPRVDRGMQRCRRR